MADRRYIAQSITDSGQVAQLVAACGPWAGLLFSWAIAFVDDDSRLVGEPDLVRHKILGRYLDLVGEEQVTDYIATMNDLELAVWYQVANAPLERYLYFPKFTLHQTLRTDRYGPSRFPPPPSWQPEEGHPYSKNPNLAKEKPQRDRRKTVRVAKRPINKGAQLTLATAGKPAGASLATAAQPSADRLAPSGDEAPRHVTPPLLTSPLPTAERNRLSEGTDELRSGATTTSALEELAPEAKIYLELTDLYADPKTWPEDKPLPGKFADGRVRDREGNVHASSADFYDWAREEARKRSASGASDEDASTSTPSSSEAPY